MFNIFFDLRGKIINFLKDHSILLSDVIYKARHGSQNINVYCTCASKSR